MQTYFNNTEELDGRVFHNLFLTSKDDDYEKENFGAFTSNRVNSNITNWSFVCTREKG